MASYALLVRESSNRVFGAAAPALAAAELAAISPHLSIEVTTIDNVEMEGLPLIRFSGEGLADLDMFLLSNLALARGAFEMIDDELLRPLPQTPLACFDSDLVTIQRYQGKTNEQFTHLLVNVALSASRSAHARAAAGERVRVLDPVAGRGSTLNRALVYGFDVAGIEIDSSHVENYKGFLSTYLKDRRFKHKITSERIRKGELAGSVAFEVRFGRDSTVKIPQVHMVRASTERAAAAFGKGAFDLVVGDLPYGIHHRAKGTRDKSVEHIEDLVRNSIGAWTAVMRPGASLGLSWNLKRLSRETLTEIVTDAGWSVVDHERSFEHIVDRQITRDVLVCVDE